MARIGSLSKDEAAPEIQFVYDNNVSVFGEVLNTTGIHAYRPSILLGQRVLADAVAGSGLISTRLRCLINVRVASLIGCPF